ncbi:Protein Jade-1 [Trichinella britovi]|uniref:Protein Jade-1 n=2 Tax=Trichinella TaxID=6333 RepID=A0A0V1D4W5_TRIBR|nr:Protein Jade-1 [Trichinella britovi]
MNRRRFHKDDDDDDSYLRGAKTAMDEQRRRLEKLLQNIEKPAYIPEKPKEWKPEPPPEFVRNVVGSSAGAGSGEYHIYRNIRKKENERLQYIEQQAIKEKLDREFEERQEERKRLAEAKTAKKRAKRQEHINYIDIFKLQNILFFTAKDNGNPILWNDWSKQIDWPLLSEKELKSKFRGAFDFRTDTDKGNHRNFAMNRKRKIESHDKENDSVILFKGLTSRMHVARTERELKHCFYVVSRWKAAYNECYVEFVPEGKQRQSIPVKRNEMFSVTPGSVRTTLRSTREDGSEFYLRCAMSIVRMHESPYKVNIQCCSVQDVHEQPEWPSASYPAACILPNYLVGNVYFVLGFVVMMIPDTEFSRNDLLLWFLQFESLNDRSPSKLEKLVCDVCRLGTSKELNEIVVCRNCENAVHQACYGIVSLPEGNWTCNRCIYMQRTGVMPSCVLCPTETGLMKSDASGTTWLHMSCALWIPGINFGNNETMESITGVEKALKKMSSLTKKNKKQMCCSICNSSFGAFIKCQNKRCSARFHVTCASNGNAFMRFHVNSENSDQVLFEIYCNAHAPVEQKDSTDTVDNTGKSSESYDLPSAEDSPALKNKTKAEISVIKEQFRLYWLVKRKQMNTTEPFVQVMRAAKLNNSDFDRTLKLSNRKKFLTDRGKKDEAKRLPIWSDDEICDKKDEDEMVHTGMRLRSSRRSKSMGPSFYYKRDNQLK